MEKGYFDLLIKIYNPTLKFPLGGKMTQFLDKLPLNTDINFIGPLGKCVYYGDGEFKITYYELIIEIKKRKFSNSRLTSIFA